MNLDGIKKIYFIGIGGIGMSAAAGIAREAGYDVEGSDSKEIYSPARDVLDGADIPYHVGYAEEHVKLSQAGLFILSSGEDLHNPEVKFVYDNNLPHASFAELLYHLTETRLRIVVTGTHGKSTTTGLLGHVLKNVDNSSFMAGAVLKNYNSNFYSGDGHYFVFEGDEYKAEWDDPTPKFHFYKPDILILTNMEYDHPDLFASFEDYKSEFEQLVAAMPEDGLIIYNADDPELVKLVHASNISSVSFGIDNEADFRAEQIQYDAEYTNIEVYNKFSKTISSQLLGQTEEYKIQLAGKINVYNALAVIAVLRALGFTQEQIALEIVSYQGVKRRFEIVGKKNGITLVDDYAHHPTEVKMTLESTRLKFPKAKLWAVFEPHTFSRTEATLPELIKAFDSADEVLISKIYPAREKFREGMITSEQVVEEIRTHVGASFPALHSFSEGGSRPSDEDGQAPLPSGSGRANSASTTPTIRLVQSKPEALDILKAEVKPGDVVVVMAVGDFNRLSYELKDTL